MNNKIDLKKLKIVMLLGSTKPFPVNRFSNAPSFLINYFVNYLADINIFVISKWHSSLENEKFDKNKFIQIRYSDILKHFPFGQRIIEKIINKVFYVPDLDLFIYYFLSALKVRSLKPDIVITHFSWELFLFSLFFYPKAKHIFYFHSSNLGDLPKKFITKLYSKGTGIISICQAAFNDLEREYGKIPILNSVILNGIDLSIFNTGNRNQLREINREKYKINNDDIVILYAGRLVRSKGLGYIIDAFLTLYNDFPNLKLAIVGDEKQERFPDNNFVDEIRKKIDNNPNIIDLGWIPYNDMINAYSISDISVLASEKIEGNSLFLIESMACGIPVISTSVGGVPEIVKNKFNGILINNYHILNELIDSLNLFVRNPQLRNQIGNNASKYIVENHSAEKMAKKLRDFLLNVVREN